MNTLAETRFDFPGYKVRRYQGKVRDVYVIEEQLMVFVASDRISAFDVILPQAIPHKGQVLNQTAAYFLQETEDICPNHFITSPDPNVTLGLRTQPYPVEMVVRGYLCGHAWRVYQSGERMICGVRMPDGLQENDPFPEPIITPSTKSQVGHDEDISRDEILKSGLVEQDDYLKLEHYTLQLYKRGTEMAAQRGLILADTKYEFGHRDWDVYLIDEIHTPDSSRYFLKDSYDTARAQGERPQQLSKEFVREWLMANGFQGQEGATPPDMPQEFVEEVSRRYIRLYEQVTGLPFEPRQTTRSLAEEVYAHTLKAVRDILD
ncbi:MAG: phosphoribosylaminoimidazolesuccinocarboxamide synthase [Bacteroidetes bacterium]|nr:phosphoribosylaminoimidazolesuccinocarboxamide synthase [Bacteroidota bacterium]